ncbi:MAG: replicative DNA helicase [Planctomycetales bacterium]|nr:replicative DNA helicase [Planctomycetales bacterium]
MAKFSPGDGPRPEKKVTSEILDRQPPFNLDAEMGVLGSIMLSPEACDDIALTLRPDDFYDDANRKLFEHMLAMHDEGRKIDSTLLVEKLKLAGDMERIGGVAYLARVAKSVPNAAHAIYYATIVREKATYRALIDASTEILREAYEENHEAKHLLGQAEQKIFGILDSRGTSNVASIRDILHEAMDRIDARMKGEHTEGGVESGFTDLDGLLGGLHNSELIILAARPSMGKTAFAMNIAENVALKLFAPVLFVSLEMSSIELADRLLCSAARVNGHRLRNGTISSEDRQRLVQQASEISQAPLFVDDSPSRTVSEISAAARRIKRREGRLGLIVIDYLQLIEPDNQKDPRQEQVAKIARRLKGVARELEVPVLCLAQLNRQAEDSKDHVPKLSHLRESGAIEQDADVVMFVHREEYYRRGEEAAEVAGQAEIIIAKQRNGPVGNVDLVWRKDFTRFEDKAPDRLQVFDNFNAPSADDF